LKTERKFFVAEVLGRKKLPNKRPRLQINSRKLKIRKKSTRRSGLANISSL